MVLSGCASTKMIDTYKNPDHVVFTAYKVLLVGITPNEVLLLKQSIKMNLKNET